jgi:hypothetical protein
LAGSDAATAMARHVPGHRDWGAPLQRRLVSVTSQDFIKFWGIFFAFVLLVLIENSQGFKTFKFIKNFIRKLFQTFQ